MSDNELRVVVDSNALQSDMLEAFLTTSVKNYAILPDYVWMEAYKPRDIHAILERMSVIRKFPDQIIVLKGTKKIAALDARAPGLAVRMQLKGREAAISSTIRALELLEQGHPQIITQVIAHGEAARAHLEKMEREAAVMADVIVNVMKLFSSKEIDNIRRSGAYSRDVLGKFAWMTEQFETAFFARHPARPKRPTKRARPNTFIYRSALAASLYLLINIRNGSMPTRSSSKLRNDMIDNVFCVYGTYFNGLMTNDKRASLLELELRVVLENIGAKVPEMFIQPLINQFK